MRVLHQAVGKLSDYIRRTSPTPEAIELVRHAKAVVGITAARFFERLRTALKHVSLSTEISSFPRD